MKLKVKINPINPTNGIVPDILKNQFHYRKHKEFIGKSSVEIAEMKEATWWNRPLIEDTNELLKLESDGLYSFNLPIAFKYDKWKSNYNVLLNENNAPLAIHLCFKNELSEVEYSELRMIASRAVAEALIEVGIPKEEIVYINNDVLLNGKKFCGGECIHDKNIFEENIFLTLSYLKEEDTFKRLTIGKVKPKREITGVFDEFNVAKTKDQFLKVYKNKLEKLFNDFLEKHKDTNELINL